MTIYLKIVKLWVGFLLPIFLKFLMLMPLYSMSEAWHRSPPMVLPSLHPHIATCNASLFHLLSSLPLPHTPPSTLLLLPGTSPSTLLHLNSTGGIYVPIVSPCTSFSLQPACLSPPSAPPSAYQASPCHRPHLLHPSSAPAVGCASLCHWLLYPLSTK